MLTKHNCRIGAVKTRSQMLGKMCEAELCSPRGHGSREWCDDCGKSDFDLIKSNLKTTIEP